MDFKEKQIRMALACVGWDEKDLAEAVGMDRAQLSKIMTGKTAPRPDTQRKLIRKLEDMGAEFMSDGGVRPRLTDIQVYEGEEGWKSFSDDRYQVALNSSRDFLFCGGLQDDFASAAGAEYHQWHSARMKTIQHFKMRGLRPLSYKKKALASYIEYRALSDSQFPHTPFYVYGGKLALLRFQPGLRVYVIQDRVISDSYRTLFETLWSIAVPLLGANDE